MTFSNLSYAIHINIVILNQTCDILTGNWEKQVIFFNTLDDSAISRLNLSYWLLNVKIDSFDGLVTPYFSIRNTLWAWWFVVLYLKFEMSITHY